MSSDLGGLDVQRPGLDHSFPADSVEFVSGTGKRPTPCPSAVTMSVRPGLEEH